MRYFLFILAVTLAASAQAQTYEEIKSRYDKYLNYKGNLDKWVELSPAKIVFYKYEKGKKLVDFTLPASDWCWYLNAMRALGDSAGKLYPDYQALKPKVKYEQKDCAPPVKKLAAVKIMLDPGHMAGDMQMARIEQKYLHLTKQNDPTLAQDSVDIAEGLLTFQTASLLKAMLEEKGATVALTRKNNSTSFGITYDEWFRDRRKKTLDSLLKIKKITAARHKWLMKMNKSQLFPEFFKDHELVQRAKVINAFKPDLTVIIHYNVDEKNAPWLKTSNKNFCMAFIPGCLTADNLSTTAGKLNFLRLLLADDVNESEKASAYLVKELSAKLNIAVAKSADASYLAEHCVATSSPGVFSRNLALCRLVRSPLIYGECLYQDCDKECYELLKNTENRFGIQTNRRVVLAAGSFYDAILRYFP
jgi:N-acetylmuramoyl-L-alanine amidase